MGDPEPNYAMQQYLTNQDKKRKNALASSDYVIYAGLCDELGIAPEMIDEYNQGKTELTTQVREAQEGLEGIVEQEVTKEEKIINFLNVAKQYNHSLFEQSEAKSNELIKYFPGRFGPKGKQPIKAYSPPQQCAIFNYVKNSYEKKMEDKK